MTSEIPDDDSWNNSFGYYEGAEEWDYKQKSGQDEDKSQ